MEPNGAIDLYKELNEYQRHFNTIQAGYRNMASAWFLGAVAGTGYVLTVTKDRGLAINPWALEVLLGIAGTVGILALWRMDLLLYHYLLLHVREAARELERENAMLPKLRFEGVFARDTISQFYMAGCGLMLGLATLGLIKRWSDFRKTNANAPWLGGWEVIGAIAILALVCCVMRTWWVTRSAKASGPDALIAAPEHHTKLLENRWVRVLEERVPPGQTTKLHTHRLPGLVHVVSGGAFVRFDQDGKVLDQRTIPAPEGPPSVIWFDAMPMHFLQNVGECDLRILCIEMKNTGVLRGLLQRR